MGALYSGTAVSGYNANPPPDDGTTGANNQVTWAGTIKAKIGDPLNTAIAAMSAALVTAMTKTLSGGSVVSTAVDYPAGAADQGRNIVFTVSGKTFTTPDATSVLSPFVMCVNNQSSGNITLAGFGGTQNIDGANTAKLGKGRGVIIWTDAVNWFSSGLVMGNLPLANPPFGFDSPINLQINSNASANLFTLVVKANDGTDPTTSNPILVPFQHPIGSITNAAVDWVAITAALSMNSNAVGATLGTVNSVPFRIWFALFNNAGTAVLAIMQTVTGGASPTAIAPVAEYGVASTTAISAAATSAGVWYTPNGTTLTNKAFRLIGYCDYTTGLATAGTYSAAPTLAILFGPGIKKPGDIVQTGYNSGSGGVTASISPTSTVNIVRVASSFYLNNGTSGVVATAQLQRNGSNIGRQVQSGVTANTFTTEAAVSLVALDAPATTSSTSYTATTSSGGGINGQATIVDEIMV